MMRHNLALLVLLCSVLTMAACGTDNDTPLPTPTPVSTTVAPPPTTPAATNTPTVAVPTDTPGGEPTATPTATPTVNNFEFACDFSTSFTCVGGDRNGQVCRPARAGTPQPGDLCPGGECQETTFFCKGGDLNGQACQRPRNTRTPEPCTGGGRCQNSELQICTQGVCPIVARRLGGGRIDVTCDAASGACTGILDEFDPVDIPGIGYVCVRAVPATELSCPAGNFECQDGGAGLDYNLLQVHKIELGPGDDICGVPGDPNDTTGNGECETACRAYCEGQTPPAQMIDFGCTGYCKSGGEGNSKKNHYCECDSATTQCMLTGGEFRPNCAPNGSCNGNDNDAPRERNVCGCQCLTEGGNPSRAGAMNMRVGAQIIVETAPPCGSGAVLLTLAPQCIPLTTEISTGVLTNANNPPDAQECPDGQPTTGCAQIPAEGRIALKGSPVSCANLMAGNVTNMNIVGNISFFDSTIGDIETSLDWVCK